MVSEPAVRRWADFEVGGRDERTFLRLYGQLPDADLYCTDGYQVYDWPPAARRLVDKASAVNRNEGWHSFLRGKLPVGSADERVQQAGGCAA